MTTRKEAAMPKIPASVRVYSEEDLALFARHQPDREPHRPRDCTKAARCWVEVGPPVSKSGGCIECGGLPRHFGSRQ